MITTDSTTQNSWKESVSSFLHSHPLFDEHLFIRDMSNLFITYEQAVANQNIQQLRTILSNGLSRELLTRFEANNKLGESYQVGRITFTNVKLERVEKDGHLFLLYLHFEGSMEVVQKRKGIKLFDKKKKKDFSTYWVLYRTDEGKAFNFRENPSCPNCDSILDGAKCGDCGTTVNNGSYGWVLSRVMAEQDLLEKDSILRSKSLELRQQVLAQVFPQFTVHELEDVVYNGFMQIVTARMQNEPTLIRPLFSDRFYERESMSICDATSIYAGLHLNNITLVAVERQHGYSNVFCNVSFTSQRIEQTGKKKSESTPIQRGAVIHLIRREPAIQPKGNLYEGTCPPCAMPVEYEVDVECPHCKTRYNSGDSEWIIADILSLQTFQKMLTNGQHNFAYAVVENDLTGILSIRDYVLNNVMVICASDQIITTEEIQFIDDIAVMLEYSAKEREQIHRFLAGTGSLRLRLPQKTEDKRRVLELMKKAAEVDYTIAPEEQAILSYIETEIARNEGTIL